MTETYELGQIIYVLSDKTQTIVPVRVEEEFVHKKINGNFVSYKVAIGPSTKQKIVELEKIDGEVFTNLDKLKETLMSRFTTFVEKLVSGTEERVKEWYEDSISKDPTVPSNSEAKLDPQTLMEQVNNTTKQPSPSVQSKSTKTLTSAELEKERLRSMLAVEEDLNNPAGSVVLDNGQVVKVSYNLNGNNNG